MIFRVLILFLLITVNCALAAPERIVSTSPHITEILCDLGLEERLAGVTENCDYPPCVSTKPKVGSINISTERLIRLKPDLVVIDKHFQPQLPARFPNLNLLIVDCSSIAKFKQSVRKIALYTGTEIRCQEKIAQMEQHFRRLQKQQKHILRKQRVFVEIWDSPLMSCGDKCLIGEIIRLSGGVNVAADTLSGYGRINSEFVLRANPQVMILTTSAPKTVLTRSAWRNVCAVQSGKVFRVDPNLLSRPSFRMAVGAQQIFTLLYPEDHL